MSAQSLLSFAIDGAYSFVSKKPIIKQLMKPKQKSVVNDCQTTSECGMRPMVAFTVVHLGLDHPRCQIRTRPLCAHILYLPSNMCVSMGAGGWRARYINLKGASSHMTQKVPIAAVAVKMLLNQISHPGGGIKSSAPTQTHTCTHIQPNTL